MVYGVLFTIMLLCGMIAASKEQRYVAGSGLYQKNRQFFSSEIWFLLLSFTCVFGCRWGVGRDYFRYLNAYTGTIPERYEFLFQRISELLQAMGLHFSFFFGLWAFLDILFIYYSIRNYRFIFPYVAYFLIFGSQFLPMMNAVRQYLAAVIFMASIGFIEKKQPVKYFVACVIGLLFHKLSIILFVFYPILRYKDDWFKGYFIQVSLLLVSVFLNLHGDIIIRLIEMPFRWFSELMGYDIYSYEILFQDRFDRSRFGRGTGLGLWINVILTLFVIFTSKHLKSYYKSSYFNMFYTLYFLGVLFSLVLGKSVILNRVTMFFSLFQVVIYSMFVYYCFNKKATRPLPKYILKTDAYLLYIMAFAMMLIQIPLFINMVTNPESTISYLFFWQGNMGYLNL